jgi:hypothetical protein
MSTCLWATGYYVDKNHLQANNSNPGTAALPWLTIQRGIDVAQPGDTVYVKTGTYNETLLMKTAGRADAMIVFKALPRRTARVYRIMLTTAYTRVEGFEITFSTPGTAIGINLTADNTEAVDNYIYDMSTGINMSFYRNNVYLADNRIYHCQYGIIVACNNCVIANNEIERMYKYTPNGSGDSDYSRFFGTNILFKGNYLHGTIYSEIGDAHLDCWQTFDDGNDSAVNVTFDGNRCSECGEGLMGEASNYGKSHHLLFKNNIFAHSLAWGLCVYNIANVEVYNNVFYDIAIFPTGFNEGWSINNVVKNNIYYQCNTSYYADVAKGARVTGDYNIIYQCKNPDPQGAHDIIGVDPKFVDPANLDFHLQAGSPAINAGTSVDNFVDFDGKVRPYDGAYDIGVYEYGAPQSGMDPADNRPGAVRGPAILQNPLPQTLLRALRADLRVFDMAGREVRFEDIAATGVYFLFDQKGSFLGKAVIVP